jgi:hypothetical protein
MPKITKQVGSIGHNLVLLTGVVQLGDDGAIGTGATDNDCEGFTIAQTDSEAGRYTCTIADKYKAIQFATCVVEVDDDDAVTDQKAAICVLRAVSASGKTATFSLLGADGDGDFADRDPQNGSKLRFLLVCSTGNL